MAFVKVDSILNVRMHMRQQLNVGALHHRPILQSCVPAPVRPVDDLQLLCGMTVLRISRSLS